jgi:uncharacterized membrane protein YeaQ/YmgE (transglycosylase-associated protein family)
VAYVQRILPGLGLGLIASKTVSATGEGTIVDILLGIASGRLLSLFNLFGRTA